MMASTERSSSREKVKIVLETNISRGQGNLRLYNYFSRQIDHLVVRNNPVANFHPKDELKGKTLTRNRNFQFLPWYP